MKEPTALNQALADAVTKSSAATGEVFDAGKLLANDIYSATKTGATKVIDFASAQIPDIIHQLLMWKIAEASVYIIATALIVVAFFVIKKKLKAPEASFAWNLFGGVTLILAVPIVLVKNVLTIVQIYIAPKLYLIEYTSELLKKAVN